MPASQAPSIRGRRPCGSQSRRPSATRVCQAGSSGKRGVGHVAEGVESGGPGRRWRLEDRFEHGGAEDGVDAVESVERRVRHEVVAVQRPAAGADLGAKARLEALEVLQAARAAQREHGRVDRGCVGDGGQHPLGAAEQRQAGKLARQAGEVDRDAGEHRAGQAGEAAGRFAGKSGQHAFAAVAKVDREQQFDGQAGRASAQGGGGGRVAEQDAVGDLSRRRDVAWLGRAQQRERRQRVGGEPHEGGQAGVGEAGRAGLEHGAPDRRLAVDGFGHADELDAGEQQPFGKRARGAIDGIEIEGELGLHGDLWCRRCLPERQGDRPASSSRGPCRSRWRRSVARDECRAPCAKVERSVGGPKRGQYNRVAGFRQLRHGG